MAQTVADPIAAVFGDEDNASPTPAARLAALEWLTARYPYAPVAAMNGAGLVVAMPESLPLRENPVLQGRSGLDLVVVDERVLAGWDRILERGAATYLVHPTGHPDAEWTLYGLDLRATHDVIVTLSVPEEGEDGEYTTDPATLDPLTEFASRAPRCATVRKDPRALILSVDAATTQMLGWSEEQMIGRRSTEFIHPDDHDLAHDGWMEMITVSGPGRRLRLRHLCADGSWVWLELTNNNQLADPEHNCVLCEMVDISEEMAVHELLNRLAEAVPVGLLQIDRDGRVVYSNDRLHEILGVARMDTMQEQLSSLEPEHTSVLADAIDSVLGDGGALDVEAELRHPTSGESRFCAVAVRALNDGNRGISGAIACVSDITDSINMREELRRRSTYDELTGCLNRATIMGTLQTHLAADADSAEDGADDDGTGAGSSGGCAAIFVDLDSFKPINDRYGHAAGDELLRVMAGRLRDTLRAGDEIGRLGGDEFLIVSSDVADPQDALALAERIAAAQADDVQLARANVRISFSVGVAWSGEANRDAEALVASADEAMYRSKSERLGRPKLAALAG
jgi:diguanylate cyclase (GGDEF)-like protein/PAS domain S-box-containing protein